MPLKVLSFPHSFQTRQNYQEFCFRKSDPLRILHDICATSKKKTIWGFKTGVYKVHLLRAFCTQETLFKFHFGKLFSRFSDGKKIEKKEEKEKRKERKKKRRKIEMLRNVLRLKWRKSDENFVLLIMLQKLLIKNINSRNFFQL